MASKKKAIKALQCIRCGELYSLRDVRHLRFFPSTGICESCYRRGQQTDARIWCFGKKEVKKGSKIVRPGFNKESLECKAECPDRKICPYFIQIKLKELNRGKEE